MHWCPPGTNGCPCGFLSDPAHECTCSVGDIQHYRARISGPLLDRIDIHVEVPAVRYKELADRNGTEKSEPIRERVNRARKVQLARFDAGNGNGHGNGSGRAKVHCNAQMTARQIQEFCTVDSESHRLLEMVIDKLGFSARAYTRILKVARTIADLDGAEQIRAPHVSEAIQYRCLDRMNH